MNKYSQNAWPESDTKRTVRGVSGETAAGEIDGTGCPRRKQQLKTRVNTSRDYHWWKGSKEPWAMG